MLGIGKLSTVIYIRTATLLLSIHAIQLQQAVEVDRECKESLHKITEYKKNLRKITEYKRKTKDYRV